MTFCFSTRMRMLNDHKWYQATGTTANRPHCTTVGQDTAGKWASDAIQWSTTIGRTTTEENSQLDRGLWQDLMGLVAITWCSCYSTRGGSRFNPLQCAASYSCRAATSTRPAASTGS